MGLWHATVAEYMFVYVFHSWSSAGILVGSTPAVQAYDVKCIELDSHSAIYAIFVLDTTIECCGEFKKLCLCKS